MTGQQIRRFSGKVLVVLSFTALLSVFSGYTRPPLPDEARRHIFFSSQSWHWWPRFFSFLPRRIGRSLCDTCDGWHFQPLLRFLRL
jgi:hypothetical protein